MNKFILLLLLIFSTVITWYKYYNNFLSNDILQNYLNHAYKDVTEKKTIIQIRNYIWKWNLIMNKEIKEIWSNFIRFDIEKIYTSDFKREYPKLFSELKRGGIYDYEIIEYDNKSYLTFISRNFSKWKFLNLEKNYLVENSNWIIIWNNKIKKEVVFFTLNTEIRDKSNNNEIIKNDLELLNSLNNWELKNKTVLSLETYEEKWIKYVIKSYIKKLNIIHKKKIRELNKDYIKIKEEQTKELKEFKSLYHSENTNKINNIFKKNWIKYHELSWYSKNINKLKNEYRKQLEAIVLEYIQYFSL